MTFGGSSLAAAARETFFRERLSKKRVLVTAGPTWEPIDAVRHVSNFATGGLGLLLARHFAGEGAEVTLLLGPGRTCPTDADRRALRVVDFVTFDDLHALVRGEVGSGGYDAMVHTAAVGDFRPERVEPEKVGSAGEWLLRLVPTPKIVDEVKELAPEMLLVKFKLEVGRTRDELLATGAASRAASRAELIVVNDRAALGPDRHPALIMDEGGLVGETETRAQLAERLTTELAVRLEAAP